MNINLYVKRKENRMNQSDVAKRLRISSQTYHLKETGKRKFDEEEMRGLAKLFNCTLDELFMN